MSYISIAVEIVYGNIRETCWPRIGFSYTQQASRAMASVKMQDVVKNFDGKGDVTEWLKKLKLVCEMQKVKDVSHILPLFLEGAAFSVYDQLSDWKKRDATEIKQALIDAFSIDCFTAYEIFQSRKCKRDEPVDVFLTELKRLAKLAGVESENLIKCAFVVGLPDEISRQLRISVEMKNSSLENVVRQARIMMSGTNQNNVLATVRTNSKHSSFRSPNTFFSESYKDRSLPTKKRVVCRICEGDHLTRNCSDITCYKCQAKGHIALYCLNEKGKSYAPQASL